MHLIKSENNFLIKQTEIQTLIFSKSKFTRSEAIAWAKANNFRSDKVDETSTSFRLRQKDPSRFMDGSFRTITLKDGVKAVIGKPKKTKNKIKKEFWKGLITN